MKTSIVLIMAMVCFSLTVVLAVPPDPLLYFDFDAKIENDGTAGFEEGLGQDIDTNDGLLPTYAPGLRGYTLDLTQNTMGQFGNFARFCNQNDPNVTSVEGALNSGLKSFTITGWMYVDVNYPASGTVSLFKRALDSGDFDYQIRLCSNDQYGRFRLIVNNVWSGGDVAEMAYWGIKDRWIFFAVTYDGTANIDNVKFYTGYDDYEGHLWLAATSTLDAGTVQTADRWLYIGATTQLGHNSWSGKLDEMKFFGSTADSSGALTLADLQDVHTEDMQPLANLLPEPLVYVSFDNTWVSEGSAGIDVADIHVGRTEKYWYNLWGGAEEPWGVVARPQIDNNGVRCQCLNLYDPNEARMWDYHGRVAYGQHGVTDTAVEKSMANLKSFTLTGWFNTGPDNPSDPNANKFTGGGETFLFQGPNPFNPDSTEEKLRLRNFSQTGGGNLGLIINGETIAASESFIYNFWGYWTFFAVTYDSTATDPNEVIKFYGAANNASRNIKLASLNDDGLLVSSPYPVVDNAHYPLIIANQTMDGRRNVKAFWDEIMIYGSKTDGSGVLTADQIKAIRARAFDEPGCPETPVCFDPNQPDLPYLPGDLNYDCVVNLKDFAIGVANWLVSNQP